MRITIKKYNIKKVPKWIPELLATLPEDLREEVVKIKNNKGIYKNYSKKEKKLLIRIITSTEEIVILAPPDKEQLKTIAIIENSLLAKNYKKNKKKEDYDK